MKISCLWRTFTRVCAEHAFGLQTVDRLSNMRFQQDFGARLCLYLCVRAF
jgi:hypothetical protein